MSFNFPDYYYDESSLVSEMDWEEAKIEPKVYTETPAETAFIASILPVKNRLSLLASDIFGFVLLNYLNAKNLLTLQLSGYILQPDVFYTDEDINLVRRIAHFTKCRSERPHEMKELVLDGHHKELSDVFFKLVKVAINVENVRLERVNLLFDNMMPDRMALLIPGTTTVRRLSLTDSNVDSNGLFHILFNFPQLTYLNLANNKINDVSSFLAYPLTQLESLNLEANSAIKDFGGVTTNTNLKALCALGLDDTLFNDSELVRMSLNPHLSLKSLDLQATNVTNAGLAVLLKAHTTITELNFNNNIENPVHILRSIPHLRLKGLELIDVNSTSAQLVNLIRLGVLDQVQSLAVFDVDTTPFAAMAEKRLSLTRLALHEVNDVSLATLPTLLNSPLNNLQVLEIQNCTTTISTINAIFTHAGLNSLRILRIQHDKGEGDDGDKIIKSLSLSGLSLIEELQISAYLSDDGLNTIAQSTNLKNLRILDISSNPCITLSGVSLIGRSTFLPQLEEFRAKFAIPRLTLSDLEQLPNFKTGRLSV